MLCSAAIYTFSAVITYMDGSGEGEWGAYFLAFLCLLCLWCNVGSAIRMESIIQFPIQFFFYKSAFYMISVEMH